MFFITKASLGAVLATAVFFNEGGGVTLTTAQDLSSYGYNYVQNTASLTSTGWLTWSPSSLLLDNGATNTKPYKEYTSSKHNITSIEQCASKCSSSTSTDDAQFGSWHEEYGTCWCITLPPTSLCREPCVSESLIDFSTTVNFNDIPWCTKSYCDVDWFYDETYCTVMHDYDGEKCNDVIDELMMQTTSAIDNESNNDDESSESEETLLLPYCLLIKTLADPSLQGSKSPDGYVTFQVDVGSGFPHDNISEIYAQDYDQDEIVLNKCYPTPIKSVQVYGPDNNGWRGNVLSYYSTSEEEKEEEEEGNEVYVPMVCIEGCTGSTNLTAPLAVDGNDNGGDRDIANCLNGNVCVLSVSDESDETNVSNYVDDETETDEETAETGADDPDNGEEVSFDLSVYGYDYVQDTSKTLDGVGWITFPPEHLLDESYIEFTLEDDDITSVSKCAAKCQSVDAPFGSYSAEDDLCWCVFVAQKDLCREPCVPGSYVDFSRSPMDEHPYCLKSSCHEEWYYVEEWCDDQLKFDKDACDANIYELNGIDPPPPVEVGEDSMDAQEEEDTLVADDTEEEDDDDDWWNVLPGDISIYGYGYVHDSHHDTQGTGWLTWAPSQDGTFSRSDGYVEFTTANDEDVNSLDTCASKCSDLNAPSGSWSEEKGKCWCIMLAVPDLCREPCVEDKFVDFSVSPIDLMPYCEKSTCDEEWYSNEGFCDEEATRFDKDTCDATIEDLHKYCILITTGENRGDNGRLNVLVDYGHGYLPAYMAEKWHGQYYAEGEVVLDQCYASLEGVQINNPLTNSWKGSVLLSLDQKKTYSPFVCEDCTGSSSMTNPIIVDGDEGGKDESGAMCLNGASCQLTNHVSTEEEEVVDNDETDDQQSKSSDEGGEDSMDTQEEEDTLVADDTEEEDDDDTALIQTTPIKQQKDDTIYISVFKYKTPDLSMFGYPYVEDSAPGWISWPPQKENISVLEFGHDDGITTTEACAARCQKEKAPSGSWSQEYNRCWCNKGTPVGICLEPCVEHEYVDFSINPFSDFDFCEKSVCDKEWYYDEQYCDVELKFDKQECDARIEKLMEVSGISIVGLPNGSGAKTATAIFNSYCAFLVYVIVVALW